MTAVSEWAVRRPLRVAHLAIVAFVTAACGTINGSSIVDAPVQPVADGKAPPGAAAARPAVSGVYLEKTVGVEGTLGSEVPLDGTGRLAVSPVDPSDGEESWSRFDPSAGSVPYEQIAMRFVNGGIFLQGITFTETIGGQRFSIACTMQPMLPAPPWPPRAGTSVRSAGTCPGTRVTITAETADGPTLRVQGVAHPTVMFTAHIRTSGAIVTDAFEVNFVALDLHLPLRTELNESVTFGSYQFERSEIRNVVSGPTS